MINLVSPLGWTNILLLISALLSLAMAIFVMTRGLKNKINLYFSLLTLSTFAWGLSLFFARTMIDFSQSQFWAYFAYIAATGIGVSLFYFTLNFPYKIKNLNSWQHCLVLAPALIFTTIVYIKNWFIIGMSRDIPNTNYVLEYNKPVYIAYAIYFILIILLALYFLWIKYRRADGVIKTQLGFLSLAIVIGLVVGTYFDLIICYFGNFQHAWLGPVFTLFMNAAVFYLIFFEKKH
jgi:hypothetical protein